MRKSTILLHVPVFLHLICTFSAQRGGWGGGLTSERRERRRARFSTSISCVSCMCARARSLIHAVCSKSAAPSSPIFLLVAKKRKKANRATPNKHRTWKTCPHVCFTPPFDASVLLLSVAPPHCFPVIVGKHKCSTQSCVQYSVMERVIRPPCPSPSIYMYIHFFTRSE